jgi:hypothetical protein
VKSACRRLILHPLTTMYSRTRLASQGEQPVEERGPIFNGGTVHQRNGTSEKSACHRLLTLNTLDSRTTLEQGWPRRENNLLKNAPHTAEVVLAKEWDHPYTREEAAFPAPWVKTAKFWPATSRVDNVYGDRNLVARLSEELPPAQQVFLWIPAFGFNKFARSIAGLPIICVGLKQDYSTTVPCATRFAQMYKNMSNSLRHTGCQSLSINSSRLKPRLFVL